MADQLCTVAQAKTRLGISDATDDAMLSEIIDQVTDEIQHFVGRRLVPDNGSTYFWDTAIGHELEIPIGIRTVTTLSVAATDQPDDGSGTYQAVAASAILVRPRPQERRPGMPGTTVVLTSSPIDTRIPFRTAANGAKLVGDYGPAAIAPKVARIALAGVVTEYLDRKRSGQAGADGIDLPKILGPDDLASLARLRTRGGFGGIG